MRVTSLQRRKAPGFAQLVLPPGYGRSPVSVTTGQSSLFFFPFRIQLMLDERRIIPRPPRSSEAGKTMVTDQTDDSRTDLSRAYNSWWPNRRNQ